MSEIIHLNPKPDTSFINRFAEEIKSLITPELTSSDPSDILIRLIGAIPKINFRDEAGLPDGEKLARKHFVVVAIRVILRVTVERQLLLGRNQAFIYLFNGSFWQVLEKDILMRFLKEAVIAMGIDSIEAEHYQFPRELFAQFDSEAFLPVPKRKDKVLINLANGTFEITPGSRKLRPYDSADFLTYCLGFSYDKRAKAPLFMQYLNRVLPDTGAQMVLAEFIGYVFLPHGKPKLEKVLMLLGPGANGKSVFFEVISALLGSENVTNYSLQSITEHEYYRAVISNKLLNYVTEIGTKLSADMFKKLASGEPIEGRLPYGKPMIITEYAKLICNVNELPKEIEHSDAYFRRFLICPFQVSIPEEEQIKDLHTQIIDNELPGVFNWVLEGLDRLLLQKGFTKSALIEEYVAKYKKDTDSVHMFIEDKGYHSTAENNVRYSELYTEYKEYTLESGFKPLNKTNFRLRMERLGFPLSKTSGNINVFYITNQENII